MEIPERDPAVPGIAQEEVSRKQRETKDDGRYIIFYSFGSVREVSETEDESAAP